MTIKMVEYWLDRRAKETLVVLVDHLVTESELNSIEPSEIEQVADILGAQDFPRRYLCDKEFFERHIARHFVVGRDLDDGCMVAIAPWDVKAVEVASL